VDGKMEITHQHVGDAGSPLVESRTYAQGRRILNSFAASEQQIEAAKTVLRELQGHLVRCEAVRNEVDVVVAASRAFRPGDDHVIPSVPNVQEKAENFLQAAKLAVQTTSLLLVPFFGELHTSWTVVPSPNPGPTYNQLLGVAGFSGGHVWAVGQAHISTLIMRTSD
jgi:hypothetical protein